MEQKTIYYISEAAKKVQVESHVLRYWEEELELPIMRNEMGHRYYTEQDIRQLQEIKQLKEQGLQLKAIRTILLRMPEGASKRTEEIFMQQASQLAEAKGKPEMTNAEKESRTKITENGSQSENKEISGNTNMPEDIKKAIRPGEKDRQEPSGMDFGKPQRFVVALSKDREELAEAEQEYDTAEDKSRKAARLQYLLQHMITEAVRSANKELCTDVKESILKELDYQFRMQEERDEERWKKEEEHYRKIDEMIRERHRPKERLARGKKKSPVKDDSINP